MDLTEAFTPSQAGGGGDDKPPTDYFDFVVSPPDHEGSIEEADSILRASCRSISFFHGVTDRLSHEVGFIKETNNNTLTALPPVSTITGALGHITHRNARNHGHCHLSSGSDTLGMDQSGQDCDYWVTEDTKEQTCNILLEDLNKYCWTTQTGSPNDHHSGLLVQRRDSPLGETLQLNHRDCSNDDRQQNTDGAIYTLTVLNSEANSMDGLDCCKSPTPGTGVDGWSSLRQNHLDLDAILNMESSVSIGGADATNADASGSATDRDDRQVVVTANGTTVDSYKTVTTSQFTTNDQFVTVKTDSNDNNNDWKLSDRNNLTDTVTVSESTAESLLRNALQGKLYPASVTTTALSGTAASRLLSDGTQSNQEDATMQACTEEQLLLSQLDVDAYRTADYEKLKNIASEVVESYCNLEPVCNVSATTVMYTLDPASGSLGTITLPAELANVGTVTVVTTAPPQQEVLHQGLFFF